MRSHKDRSDWTPRRAFSAHLFEGHVDEAILWLGKARRANSPFPPPHALLAPAYGLKGDLARAKAELAETLAALKQRNDDRYGTIAFVRRNSDWNMPPLRDRFEEFFITGLRQAGFPEE